MQVCWCEWTAQAFKRAEREQKPVLLSLVTAWSEACAAMDRTTYTHPSVAQLIEDEFVAVRVDGDYRPDLNERYNLGGWPTTAFLTSAGDILSGGTYLDADEMTGVLRRVSAASRVRGAELIARADELRRESLETNRAAPVAEEDLSSLVTRFECLLLDRFDRRHGGFGSAPKFPHPRALVAALALEDERGSPELSTVVDRSLEQLAHLWDPADGGFCRYAWGEDWSQPCSERTLDDNAALLELYVEAAMNGRTECVDHAAAIVEWVQRSMSDGGGMGYHNARGPAADPTRYVDRNAMMIAALLRAAALFGDSQLRNAALASFESVVVPTYVPGDGVAHVASGPYGDVVRGLLSDQVHAAAALIWAHAATGLLPYSMLAAELMQYAIRQMWSDRDEAFRDRAAEHDPRVPFELNCLAASVLHRLAALTGESAYHERARLILRGLGSRCAALDLHAAPYVSAVQEVIGRQPPAGLELSAIDWGLSS